MSKLRDIPQTKEAKEKYVNPLINELRIRTITREELQVMLACSDVQARQEIAEISMYYPVLSSSKRKGYRMAKSIDTLTTVEEMAEEYDLVRGSINEIISRIDVLNKKLKPLIAYQKVLSKKIIYSTKIKISELSKGSIVWYKDLVVGVKGLTLPSNYENYEATKIGENPYDYEICYDTLPQEVQKYLDEQLKIELLKENE